MLFLTTSVGGLVASGGLRLLVGLLKANIAVYRLLGATAMNTVSGVTALGRAVIFLSTAALKGTVASVKGLWKALLGIPGTAAKAGASIKGAGGCNHGLAKPNYGPVESVSGNGCRFCSSIAWDDGWFGSKFYHDGRCRFGSTTGLARVCRNCHGDIRCSSNGNPDRLVHRRCRGNRGRRLSDLSVLGANQRVFRKLVGLVVMDAGSRAVAWFSSLDFSSYLPSISWSDILTALDWASWILPVRWLDFIPGFSWKEIFKTVLDWADFIPIPDFRRLFRF